MFNRILGWKAVSVWSAILAVVALIQYGGNHIILDHTHKLTTTCTLVEWNPGSKIVRMKLQCKDGEKGIIYDPDVVVSYLKNPGPLTCKRYETGSLMCEERKKQEKGTS